MGARYFSIVMPVLNREREIVRALNSCANQSFTDFEICVVDGNSADRTRHEVEKFATRDKRFRLLVDVDNRGICPARNAGIRSTEGKWVIFLDSDMALLPGALAALYSFTRAADTKTGNVISQIRLDRGGILPSPDDGAGTVVFDYSGFLRWTNTLKISEFFNCISREVFTDGLLLPDSRAPEGGFHLDLARKRQIEFHSVPSAIYYTDAVNRNTAARDWRQMKRILERNAPDWGIESRRVLREHGAALRSLASDRHREYLSGLILNALLLGRKIEAIRYWLRYTRAGGRSWKYVSSMVVGLANSTAFKCLLAKRYAKG